ncbi:TPA: Panacea domain-containing protein [Streptococcus suis]
MVNTLNLAKCFLSINPSLRVGNFDNNLKVNKLLYFASLMYFSLFNDDLIDDYFERWANGPVVREVYKEFRYNDLCYRTDCNFDEFSPDIKKIIQVTNFVYGNKTSNDLIAETHKHNIWLNASKNEHLDLKKIDPSVIGYLTNIYSIYKDIDFENLHKEVIHGNVYFYYDSGIDLTSEESLNEIKMISQNEYPIFVELIDGEMVFS